MGTIIRFLVFGAVMLVAGGAFGAPLTATAHVNVTSDTAATAKNMAMDEARRQVIVEALSPYADSTALRTAVKGEKSAVLTTLIESSGISGEQQSDTTYSANITMTVDRNAARNWMVSHGVQNWLGDGDDAGNESWVVVSLNSKLADWSRVRRVAADAGIDLNTKTIDGNQMTFRVPAARRGALTIALRDAGWRYADRDGVLYISK
ncbi:MAG: hypothetical protein IJQ90_02840 [Alphaproteobacteria bacterium]|nr:hypothetical protein [Alphaproteobacteria bacterium]